MDEIDKLKRAQMYLRKLSEGVDPITDSKLPEDTVLSHVRLSRCFAYVAGVLSRLVEVGGLEAVERGGALLEEERLAQNKASFSLSRDQAASVAVEEGSVPMATLCAKLNALIDQRRMRKLTVTRITNWLLREGYLQQARDEEAGKNVRFPTERGKELGITFETSYTYTMRYNEQAQRFVLDHLGEITNPACISREQG